MRFVGGSADAPEIQKLRRLSHQLGIDRFVEFVGFSPADKVKREVLNANILVNLRANSVWSRSGQSTKLSEYLAAGRTVLTTDIGDNGLYVHHGESALVASPDLPAEEIAQLLKQAIRDPRLRSRLGTGARSAALKHFDLPVVQRQISDALDCLSITSTGRNR
jgi:glycosyltransferase involved in cell wall biosynthesis